MASGMEIVTLPAVGLQRGGEFSFVRGFGKSYRAAKRHFESHPPQAALAMGGFTSAPPILAAKKLGAQTYLHESNAIPGRANRWLSRVVNGAFVGFPSATGRLKNSKVTVTGTPVRPPFRPRAAGVCRAALGLGAGRPVRPGAGGGGAGVGRGRGRPVLLVRAGARGRAESTNWSWGRCRCWRSWRRNCNGS